MPRLAEKIDGYYNLKHQIEVLERSTEEMEKRIDALGAVVERRRAVLQIHQ